MRWQSLWVLGLLVLVVALPIALRPRNAALVQDADDVLVIVTPHNEATRYEFARAFAAHYRGQTGRTVAIDWRTPGGASEISRYLASQYQAAFEFSWKSGGHTWTAEIEGAFDNGNVGPGDTSPAARSRKAFLASEVSSGIDLFFGGGTYDFSAQARAGRLVDSGILARHPEWFGTSGIPQTLGGEEFWDVQGRWVGACLSSFGICYNVNSLARLGIRTPPAQWEDLGSPVYRNEVALSDPTQSGSVAKAFEMLIQQEMLKAAGPGASSTAGVAQGWQRGLSIIQRASANARYFTDSASKIPWDVQAGDAAVGMCIDFYGRFQSEAVSDPSGHSRIRYLTPEGGSSVGADPIGLLRGAPHAEVARAFIDFVLSEDGQKLWTFKRGSPGGPERYTLRRLPIRRVLYQPKYQHFSADPGIDPYAQASSFQYHGEWTGALFRTIGFIVRAMCIDSHRELSEAWAALIEADFPPEATAKFSDLSRVSYARAREEIAPVLRGSEKVEEVRLNKSLSESFRENYKIAKRLAELRR